MSSILWHYTFKRGATDGSLIFKMLHQFLIQIKVLLAAMQELIDIQITSEDCIQICKPFRKSIQYLAKIFQKDIHYLFATSDRELDSRMQ